MEASSIEKFWLAITGTLILGHVIFPGLLLLGSLGFRWWREFPLSSSADTLLALAAFDGAAIAGPGDFGAFMSSEILRPHLVQIHCIMLAVTMVVWGVTVTKLEPLASLPPQSGGYSVAQWSSAVGGLIAALFLIFAHVVTYRGHL
jgi:hypothetical protein